MKTPVLPSGVMLASALGLFNAPVAAQVQIEEIIVTAQKRAESLQKVPIAVSALNTEGLEKANIQNLEDLGNAISGVNYMNNGYLIPNIRGLGTITVGAATYMGTTTYVDGLYMARSYANNITLDTAESIQVLKGPQGALYGRNATGGAVVIQTRNPEAGGELHGHLDAGYGNYDAVDVSGRLSSGMGEQAGFSIEAYYNEHDGLHDVLPSPASGNPQEDDFNSHEEYGVAGKLLFEPSENSRILLKASYMEQEQRVFTWDNVADEEFPSAAQIIQINPTLAPGVLETIVGNPGLNANAFAAAGLNSTQVLMATIMGGSLGFPAPAAIGIASGINLTPKFGKNVENLINSCEIDAPDAISGNIVSAGCQDGNYLATDSTSVSADIELNFGRFDLVSITGYTETSNASASDVGGIDHSSPGAATLLGILGAFGINNLGLGFTGQFETETIQQELRFASNDSWNWKWIVGLNYFQETSDFHGVDGNSFGGYVISTRNDWENKAYSVFAQVTYPLTDRFSVTGGGRWNRDELELHDNIDLANPNINPVLLVVGSAGNLERDDDSTTYTLRLEFQEDTWMAYGGVTTGFKSAALNADGPAFGIAEPEEITSYEVGFKSEWLDGRLQLNGAAYYYDYKDPHIGFVDNATGGQVLLNVPEGELLGADLDLVGVIGESVKWYLNATLVDTEYTDDATFFNAGAGLTSTHATDGKEFAGAPPFVLAAGFDYRIPMGCTGDLFVSPSVRYNDGVWYDAENRVGSGGADDDAFTIVNLNVQYKPAQGNWKVTLYGRNLFDEKFHKSGLQANGFLLVTNPGDPRQYGGSVSIEF